MKNDDLIFLTAASIGILLLLEASTNGENSAWGSVNKLIANTTKELNEKIESLEAKLDKLENQSRSKK